MLRRAQSVAASAQLNAERRRRPECAAVADTIQHLFARRSILSFRPAARVELRSGLSALARAPAQEREGRTHDACARRHGPGETMRKTTQTDRLPAAAAAAAAAAAQAAAWHHTPEALWAHMTTHAAVSGRGGRAQDCINAHDDNLSCPVIIPLDGLILKRIFIDDSRRSDHRLGACPRRSVSPLPRADDERQVPACRSSRRTAEKRLARNGVKNCKQISDVRCCVSYDSLSTRLISSRGLR
jgi:hypothetical protein